MSAVHRMQRRLTIGVLVAVAAGALLPVTSANAVEAKSSAGCADVKVIAARGTGDNDNGNVGVLDQVATKVSASTKKTVDIYGLPYPASLDMGSSALDGDKMLGKYVNQQASNCPAQKMVLLGYSQGAWVVGDALTGGSTLAGSTSPTITPSAGRKIAAIVLFGDPRFTAGEPFNFGTFKSGKEGNYPRPKGAYGDYSKRLRSYCDGNDQTCQNVSGLGHLGYWPKYNTSAADFILKRLGAHSSPKAVTDTKESQTKGLPPEIQKQVNKATADAAKKVQEQIDKAVSATGGQVPYPQSSAPEGPARTDHPAKKKHWWDTVFSWLNPFD